MKFILELLKKPAKKLTDCDGCLGGVSCTNAECMGEAGGCGTQTRRVTQACKLATDAHTHRPSTHITSSSENKQFNSFFPLSTQRTNTSQRIPAGRAGGDERTTDVCTYFVPTKNSIEAQWREEERRTLANEQ